MFKSNKERSDYRSILQFALGIVFGICVALWLPTIKQANIPWSMLQHNNYLENALPMPSKESILSVFRPVYVYSDLPPAPLKSYSQVGQDLVILKLLQASVKKGGENNQYFIDLAANDADDLSNTLHLEQNGWNGLCIEGNPIYWYKLAALRKCTVVGAFVGGKVNGKMVDVYLKNGALGGLVGPGLDNRNKAKDIEKRNLVTVSTVLKETNAPKIIDYMSLDVEGAESLVMQDFPFDEYKMRFLTVERPKKDLRELLYLNGYKKSRKDFSTFGETLWFHQDYIKLSPEEVEKIAELKVESNRYA